VFAAVIIFTVEYTQSVVIRNAGDVERYLRLPVLANIPRMRHLKIYQ